MGYLPEIPPVYEELTPEEYLRFVADAKGVSFERAIRQVNEAMELTQIYSMRHRLIKNLSKGYRQRVGIAQAMLGNPDIIILDEPTVGLDPKQIIEIRSLIRRLGEIKTVIISSHILAEISEICDHVLIIAGGKLIANAPIEELQKKSNAGARLKLSVRGDEAGVLETLSAIEELESCMVGVSREAGVVNLTLSAKGDADLRDRIFFALADRRYALLSMEKEETSLESIFLKLTSEAEKNQTAQKPDKKRGKSADRDGKYELIDDKPQKKETNETEEKR